MKMLQKRKKKGFTLIELMVVVAIIAVLVLLAVPRLMGNTEKSKVAVFESNFRTLVSEVSMAQASADQSAEMDKIVTKAGTLAGKPKTGVGYTVTKGAAGSEASAATVEGKYSTTYTLKFDASTGQTSVTAGAAPDGSAYK